MTTSTQSDAPAITHAGEIISAKLADLLSTIEQTKESAAALADPFVGKGEAAKFLDMSVSTLERRMAESDGPPRYIDGGKVTFLRSELRVWRRQWRVGDQTGLPARSVG